MDGDSRPERPRKRRASEQINFRTTDDIRTQIMRRASEAGMTVKDYLIAAGIGKKILVTGLAHSDAEALVALRESHEALTRVASTLEAAGAQEEDVRAARLAAERVAAAVGRIALSIAQRSPGP
jgi:hypothetical protein